MTMAFWGPVGGFKTKIAEEGLSGIEHEHNKLFSKLTAYFETTDKDFSHFDERQQEVVAVWHACVTLQSGILS